jgi:4-amino-4-deoxy-L-arabinose transferase-like glycosyltransferase
MKTVARVGWAIFILATLFICFFSHLGAIGFVGPDEPRYAWIARDMAESGDWVTPRLYGKPWFEKPVLYYWGAAASFKLFGVSEAAARLPSAISALLATLALGWLAWRLYGEETARWLLLLLPTSVGMIGFSHAAATDMPFNGMLTVATVCAAVVMGLTRDETSPVIPRTPWLALALLGIFLGLAVLAKGPAAVILSGGAIFFWALFTKRWRDAFRCLHPVAIATFCLTALPWYILCSRRNPDFFHVFIIEHNFKRFLTPEFQHIQPFWYYAPVLLVAFLPWTGLFLWSLVIGAIRIWRNRSAQDSTWFFICWAGFCVAFFSISRSKLPGYVLPAIPAVGLLLARSYSEITSAQQKVVRLVLLATASILIAPFILAVLIRSHFSQQNEKFGFAAFLVLALIATANLLLGLLSRRDRGDSLRQFAAASCVLPILLAVGMSERLVPSFFRWDPSGKSLAYELWLSEIPFEKLSVAQMSRGQNYSLNFYLHQEIKVWDKDHPTEGYLLVGSRDCKRWVPPPFVCEQVAFEGEASGRFLFRVTAAESAPSLPRSGQME